MHERLTSECTNNSHHELGCQQSILLSSITKVVCGWFQWKRKKSRFTEKFTQSFDDDSNKGYIFDDDVS